MTEEKFQEIMRHFETILKERNCEWACTIVENTSLKFDGTPFFSKHETCVFFGGKDIKNVHAALIYNKYDEQLYLFKTFAKYQGEEKRTIIIQRFKSYSEWVLWHETQPQHRSEFNYEDDNVWMSIFPKNCMTIPPEILEKCKVKYNERNEIVPL